MLISTDWITAVHWNDSTVQVNVHKEAVRNAPAYDPAGLVDQNYESLSRYYEHYGRPAYWEASAGVLEALPAGGLIGLAPAQQKVSPWIDEAGPSTYVVDRLSSTGGTERHVLAGHAPASLGNELGIRRGSDDLVDLPDSCPQCGPVDHDVVDEPVPAVAVHVIVHGQFFFARFGRPSDS